MKRIFNNIKNHLNWVSYYFFKYFKHHKNGFTFRCRGGLRIAVPQRMLQTYKESFFDQTYFKGLPSFIKIKKWQIVVDIGANVGYFSLSILAKNPNIKVYAYEPLPINFQLLKQYKKENPTFDFNIYNLALSGQKEILHLHYDANDTFSTAASIFSNPTQADIIEVKATTLESIFIEHEIDHIDFLKLDCEGAEYSILYATPPTLMSRISVLSIETHRGKKTEEDKESLSKFLRNNGFQIKTSIDQIWGWRNQS